MGCCGRKEFVSGSSSFENCLCEVIRVIKDIQDAGAEECATCATSCFLEPLGSLVNPARRTPIDTRVIVLLTKEGCPFKVQDLTCSADKHEEEFKFFRIEEILNGSCCVTLRALRKLHTTSPTTHCCFEATDVCVTVDISCFCAVQCVADCFLDLCD
ncbi:CotY/CotZ family spore coat protein [Edaphobacillus lindanitolerans]|uniref:Spore coat protein Z n=1 Tax=Edaphobacillus lindanitolerans TaxID=550447 RepID=A0A1U7PIZ7_9BACI|nr:CotY/CotZ family spore coat protein [Edaphobacillus lindanitolerans]SIT68697.1 spore coat protein Z [Edaphobacillus lindanitolerans]